MPSYIKLSDLDSFHLQDIRVDAYHLARNELARRAINDPDGEITIELANHLFEQAERWASIDEADQDDVSRKAIFQEFFNGKPEDDLIRGAF